MNENEIITTTEINETSEAAENYASAIDAEVCARIAAEEKAYRLEAKICCMEKGVKAEYAEDVITIAGALFAGEDIETAVNAVIEKYPFFTETQIRNAPVTTTGVRYTAGAKNNYSGVEAAFRKSNPNIRFN